MISPDRPDYGSHPQSQSQSSGPCSGLFRKYELDGFFDEAFEADGQIRPHYDRVIPGLDEMKMDEMTARRELADLTMVNQGITFTVYGNEKGTEKPFPVDMVPRIVPSQEWKRLEAGLEQRVRTLNLFLHDIYHSGHVMNDRKIPRELVVNAPNYRRAFVGADVPHDLYVHICGTDLIRDGKGDYFVLEDNCRTPSGVSYMLENRLILMRVFPALFARNPIRPIDDYASILLNNLRDLAPQGRDDPTVALLTPGSYNSAYFEHSFLAQQMGVELVEGRDLFVEDNQVYMKTTQGPKRVDVIYRRVDDDYLDPLVFKQDSTLGVPGLVNAYRGGSVALANGIGTGVADDKAVYPYMPDLIKYYLDQDPILPNVETFLGLERNEEQYILDNLDKLVVKPTNESGGYGMLMGPQATEEQRSEFADAIKANPRGYIAQPLIDLSRSPCFVEDHFEGRHVDLRPYILCGKNGVTIVPGALTRVALTKGSYVVNSSQGGGSKDTWVLGETLLSRHADSIYWTGRYTERAEATARMIDVHYHFGLESPLVGEALRWSSILAISGEEEEFYERYKKADEESILYFFAFDEENPSSIYSCVKLARENGRTIRDQISSEMWQCLNKWYLDLQNWDVDRVLKVSPHVFFELVKDQAHLFQGITNRTLMMGESRDFHDAGRFLERADQTSRILDVKYHDLLPRFAVEKNLLSAEEDVETAEGIVVVVDPVAVGGPIDTHGWVAVLKSVGAFEAFRKTYRVSVTPALVAQFLVLNSSFPASIRHSIGRVEGCLRRVSGNRDLAPANSAERSVGRLYIDLNFMRAEDIILSGLHEFLEGVQESLADIGDKIKQTYLLY